MSYAIPQEEPLKASIFGGQSQADNENNPSASYNKTGDTGTINAGGGGGGKQEKSAEQVQQQSAQQRQAAFPLREIFKRNTAAQVGAPDFSKTSNAIAQAGTALQNAANAYTTSNVSAVPTIDQGTINTYAGIPSPTPAPAAATTTPPPTAEATTATPPPPAPPARTAEQAGSDIIAAITPRSAALTKFELPKEATLPTENELAGRFNTSSGLTTEILKANPVVGQSRGAAGLDTAFLQGNTAFQKSKDAILGSGKEAIAKQNTLLANLPETTRVAVDAAIKDAERNARELLKTTAGGFETDAKTKQDAYEIARKELEERIADGNLSPEMKAQILAAFDAQTSKFSPNQKTMSADFKNFLADPNRMGLASSLASEIADYGGDVGNYNLDNFNNANLASGFKVADTSTNLSDFMSDDQYNPYSKISSLLGKTTTRGTSATAQPLTYDPTNATNLAIQYQQMQDAAASGKDALKSNLTSLNQLGANDVVETNMAGKKDGEFNKKFKEFTKGMTNDNKAAIALYNQFKNSPKAAENIFKAGGNAQPNFAEAAKQFKTTEDQVRAAYAKFSVKANNAFKVKGAIL